MTREGQGVEDAQVFSGWGALGGRAVQWSGLEPCSLAPGFTSWSPLPLGLLGWGV